MSKMYMSGGKVAHSRGKNMVAVKPPVPPKVVKAGSAKIKAK